MPVCVDVCSHGLMNVWIFWSLTCLRLERDLHIGWGTSLPLAFAYFKTFPTVVSAKFIILTAVIKIVNRTASLFFVGLTLLAALQTTTDCPTVCLDDKNETYAVWMLSLFCKVLDCAWRRYWHRQLYSMFYRPYCCLSGHLLVWFVEIENSLGQLLNMRYNLSSTTLYSPARFCDQLLYTWHSWTWALKSAHRAVLSTLHFKKWFPQKWVRSLRNKLAYASKSSFIYDTNTASQI